MLKKIISIAVSAIAVSCIVGCSNQSPVSVSSNATEKTAAVIDTNYRMWDVSGYAPHIWGVCAGDPAPEYGNFYLYYYRSGTASWVRSNHWGGRVAVTSFGKCFHSNIFNQVYCCKTIDLNGANESDSSGFVAAAPSGESIVDIGAGSVQLNTDRVWILCYSKKIYKGDVVSGTFQGWTQVATLPGNVSVNAIAADPSKGGRVIIATNLGADTLSNNSWQLISNSTNANDDVAWYNSSIFYSTCRVLFYHCLGYSPSWYDDGVANAGISVAGNKVWYLGHDGKVHTN